MPKAGDRVVPQRLHQGGPGATVIVPVPPSRSSRPQQPVSDRSPAPGVYTTAVSSAGARSLRMEVTQTES